MGSVGRALKWKRIPHILPLSKVEVKIMMINWYKFNDKKYSFMLSLPNDIYHFNNSASQVTLSPFYR